MRAALIAFLVASATSWGAAMPVPAGPAQHSPTMAQYNRLKARLGSMLACLGTGVPVVVHQGDDGRQYLVLPDAATDVESTILVATTCSSGA